MIEPGNSLGFTLEEAYQIRCVFGVWIGSRLDANDLDSDLSIDTSIFNKVNLSHTSTSQGS